MPRVCFARKLNATNLTVIRSSTVAKKTGAVSCMQRTVTLVLSLLSFSLSFSLFKKHRATQKRDRERERERERERDETFVPVCCTQLTVPVFFFQLLLNAVLPVTVRSVALNFFERGLC